LTDLLKENIAEGGIFDKVMPEILNTCNAENEFKKVGAKEEGDAL